jgi:acetyl-CoA synthetase
MTMGETLLPAGTSYAEVYTRFRWQIPTNFNIGVDVCDRHADDPSRLAMIYEDDTGQVSTHTFAEFRVRSNQLAHALIRLGITRGDRVGIILSQRPETAVAHLAAYKLGAIALPLSTLFGPEALDYRLRDAGAQVVVEASDAFSPVVTAAEDSALLIYTSGTTGPPKGALHAHRVLLGHLPAIEFYHEYFPKPDDRFWTPADWAQWASKARTAGSSLWDLTGRVAGASARQR